MCLAAYLAMASQGSSSSQPAPLVLETKQSHEHTSKKSLIGFRCGHPPPDKSVNATAKIDGGQERLMFLHGQEFDGKKKDIVSDQILSGSGWEKPEINQIVWALQQPLPSGHQDPKLFVDIGANIGWFTLNMAARGYQVEAFEAMEYNQGSSTPPSAPPATRSSKQK